MLGHASTSTTVDFYLHTDKERIRKTHDAYLPLAGTGQQIWGDMPRGVAPDGMILNTLSRPSYPGKRPHQKVETCFEVATARSPPK
jgi:hypothetical protein